MAKPPRSPLVADRFGSFKIACGYGGRNRRRAFARALGRQGDPHGRVPQLRLGEGGALVKAPRFVAQIQGANGSEAYAFGENSIGEVVRIDAVTSGSLEWTTLRYDGGRPALFSSREAAREAGLAAHWNGQIFRVAVARGHARSNGVLIEVYGWTSCQEALS